MLTAHSARPNTCQGGESNMNPAIPNTQAAKAMTWTTRSCLAEFHMRTSLTGRRCHSVANRWPRAPPYPRGKPLIIKRMRGVRLRARIPTDWLRASIVDIYPHVCEARKLLFRILRQGHGRYMVRTYGASQLRLAITFRVPKNDERREKRSECSDRRERIRGAAPDPFAIAEELCRGVPPVGPPPHPVSVAPLIARVCDERSPRGHAQSSGRPRSNTTVERSFRATDLPLP